MKGQTDIKEWKRCQLHWKSRRKVVQNDSKRSNDSFDEKNRQAKCSIISGTKCDRDKLIFSAERGDQY